VPAVDMVAFIDPRRSRVDIAQAAGRAMRKPSGANKVGYVVIPLFLDMKSGETLEDALQRSEFDGVADVLNAMQEQDEDLVHIIRELHQAKGQGEIFDPRRLSEKVEVLGPSIELSLLRTNICAEIVDLIGASWDEWYGMLKSYQARFGDCRVPKGYFQNGRNLGSWVRNQRYGRNRLSEERRRRLDELGFEWDPLVQGWQEGFRHLRSFKDRVGNCQVPVGHIENGFNLHQWVRHQRDLDRYPLSKERRRRLDEIGFVWDTYSSKWEIGFEHLKLYRDRSGDCRVPGHHLENGYKLGSWVSIQRRGKNKLSEEQRERLDRIGFDWDVFSTQWERGFDYLTRYKDRVGDCHISERYVENGFALGRWIRVQRNNENMLSAERLRKLDNLGFEWDPTGWEKGFKQLRLYMDRVGDCQVPVGHVENGFALGKWVLSQKKRRNRLFENQISKLEGVGFDWGLASSVDWENGFNHLKKYKGRVGDCRVPFKHFENNYHLGRWVGAQRRERRKLSEDQIRRLDELGFDWDLVSANWEKYFRYLEMYRERSGHCRVPIRHIENRVKLGRWVEKQRREKDNLSEERRKRLDEIGFEWEPRRLAKSNIDQIGPPSDL
jgi:hypothetical protein